MSKKNKKPTISTDKEGPFPKTSGFPSSTVFEHNLPVENTSQPDFWLNTRLQALIIFALSFVLYANTLTHKFCQDDAIVITDNKYTVEGFAGIPDILRYDTFFGFFKEAGKAGLVAGGRYRPFTLVQFAIEYQFFGKNAFIGHLFNVLWFGLTCVLLYFVLLKLLNFKYQNSLKSTTSDIVHRTSYTVHFIAFAAAALFAAHPIHTEAVANIKGRDEIMCLLGSLAAVWFSIKAFEKGGVLNQILAAIFFFIGLLSKENAITFVVIVPLIYWFFMETNLVTAFKQTLPFIASAAFFIILRGAVIGNQFGGEQLELMNNPYLKLVDNQYVAFSFSEKFATIIYTLGDYVRLLIFPHPLTHDYYPRHVGIMSFGDWQVILSLLIYIGLGAAILRGLFKKEIWAFGLAFYLITLSIVSNLIFPVGTNMAERFLFMPSVGFCLVVAIVLSKIFIVKNSSNSLNIKPLSMVLIAMIMLLGLKTVLRNPAWKDNYTIFTTDIEVSKNSAKLQTSVGGETIDTFKNEKNLELRTTKMKEAIEHLKQAIAIHPAYKSPYLLMGNAYLYLDDVDNAIIYYEGALKLDSTFKDARANIGLAYGAKYRDLGKKAGQVEQNLPKAIEYFTKSIEYNPNDAQVYSYIGTAYGMNNQIPKSIEALSKALSLRFDKQDALNLSVSYRIVGDVAKANEWAQRAK
jgi:protein O-mannosyl-transferase